MAASPGPERRPGLDIGWLHRRSVLVAWAFTVATAVYMLPREIRNPDRHNRDVTAYWLAVERIHDGEPLYAEMPDGPLRPDEPLYLYPPVLAPALALLPRLEYGVFSAVWSVVLFGSLWAYGAILALLASGDLSPSRWALGVLAAGVFPGGAAALGIANVDPLLWVLLGAGVAAAGVGRGAAFALAACIKPYALFPLFFAALRRPRRVVPGALAGFSVAALIGVLSLGPKEFAAASRFWVTDVLPHLGQGSERIPNLSLTVPFSRLVAPKATWLPAALAVAVPLATGVAMRRADRRIQLAAVLGAAVLAAPYLLPPYLPLMLIPLAVVLRAKGVPGRGDRAGE